MSTKKFRSGFTLVELIVVIVILSILATIAFLSFQNQSSSARDSTRLSDLNMILKGIKIHSAVAGKPPQPDAPRIEIYSGSYLIGYQGYAGENIRNIIKMSSNGGKDPLDGSLYVYNISALQSKAQLVGFLEDKSSVKVSYDPFFGFEKNIFATTVTSRYPVEKGDTLGVILQSSGSNMTPIQDLESYSTGADLTSASVSSDSSLVAMVDNSMDPSNLYIPKLQMTYAGTGGLESLSVFPMSDNDLKNMFSSGSAYTSSWSGNTCSPASMSIVEITNTGAFLSGITLADNTIYKIYDGTYLVNSNGITLGKCSALIGQSNSVIIKRGYNEGYSNGLIRKSSAITNTYDIIYGLTLDGNKSSKTSSYNNGIYLNNSSSNTISNVNVHDNASDGILLSYSDYNSISDMVTYKNSYDGITMNYSSNNILMGIKSYTNLSGIALPNSSSKNTFNKIEVYGNTNDGLSMHGADNVLKNILSYNNTTGISISSAYSSKNMFNNIQTFNNSHEGINIGTSGNSYNNIQSYNNSWYGIYLSAASDNIFNNISVYNNSSEGFYLLSNSNNNILNNVRSYNNSQSAFALGSGANNIYFGSLYFFANLNDSNPITKGTSGTGTALGWPNGTYSTGGTMGCSYHSDPLNGSYFGSDCTLKGKSSTLPVPIATSWSMGSNLPNQARPIKSSGSTWINYGTDGIDYYSSVKIGKF